MVAGAAVGGGLGLVAGGISVGLLKLTGTSMEEVRYWQYKWKTDREQAYREGFDKSLQNTPLNHKSVIQDLHDIKIGVTRPNLDELPDEPPKKVEAKVSTENKEEEVEKSPENEVKEASEKQ